MSPFARGMCCGAALVGAFFAGYFLKFKLKSKTETPPAVAEARVETKFALGPTPQQLPIVPAVSIEPPPMPVAAIQAIGPRTEIFDSPPIPHLDFDKKPSGENEPVNLSDPAAQLIKQQLGIKTTILDDFPPPMPLPGMDPNPVGSSPKLDIPPRVVPSAKLINKRDLLLDFEMTRIGSSKIASVELWTTRDNGTTWACTDKMKGGQSPFKTRLGSDGEYGFRLLLESETGIRTPEPAAGQLPEMCVCLDTTGPKVALLPIEPIADQPGRVKISWRMSDVHLDCANVKLEYSVDACEWVSIASPDAFAPSDSYSAIWETPADAQYVLFRVTACDLAGNVTSVQTPSKVLVDLIVPEGKLTGARAETMEPEIGPMPRRVDVAPELKEAEPINPVDSDSLAYYDAPRKLKISQYDAVYAWIRKATDIDVLRAPEPRQICGPRYDEAEFPPTLPDRIPDQLAKLIDATKSFGLGLSPNGFVIFDITNPNPFQVMACERARNSHWHREWLRLGKSTHAFSGGRCLMNLLTESEWKPSTAPLDSLQWEYKSVDPMWFWGSFPPTSALITFSSHSS